MMVLAGNTAAPTVTKIYRVINDNPKSTAYAYTARHGTAALKYNIYIVGLAGLLAGLATRVQVAELGT